MGHESTSNYKGPLKIGTPAIYQIEVQGKVDISWSDNLAGMNITSNKQDDNAVTILIGRLSDQAALAGLLQSLYEMKLPILSVEYKG
ncbi:MAG: hypothetical protein WBH40_05820 [Ignavibacteriaceae bacterium]